MGEKEPESEKDFPITDEYDYVERLHTPYFSARRRWRKIKAPIEPEQQINQQQEQGNKGE